VDLPRGGAKHTRYVPAYASFIDTGMEKHRTLRKKQIWIQQIVSKRIAKKSDSANCQQKYRRKFESANCQQKNFAFSKYSAKMRTDKGIQQIVSKFLAQESKIGDRSVKEKIYLGQCWPDSYFSQRRMPSLPASRLKWLG
jgi:hypothetical protein